MNTGVSVIICCHNSEDRLPKVLESLGKQADVDQLRWEIIIVDNASTDNTRGIIKKYLEEHPLPVKVVSEPEPGLSYARGTGMKAAQYDFICFVDDDNWIHERYIAKVHEILVRHADVGLCGGRGIPAFETTAPDWFETFQNAYAVGPQWTSSGYMTDEINRLYGAGMTLRRSAWHALESNGFSYHLTGRKGKSLSSGEDSELSVALQLAGYRLWYEPSLTFFHYMPAVRLNYAYLKNLFRAFGRADVVITVYYSFFNEFSYLKKKVIRNYYLCFIYNVYSLFKLLGNFLFSGGNKTNRMRRKLNLVRGLSRTIEHGRMVRRYKYLVASIEGSKWIADTRT
jgi:glycosyltransferase involved in cell wall biosynthesis